MSELRESLPEIPANMKHLPIDRGFPVPYFVAWFDDEGHAIPTRGEGKPDFRVLYPNVVADCWNHKRCWVCGKSLGTQNVSYVAGPMCAVNRTSAEPPSHHDCAVFSAKGCPFLSMPKMVRRDNAMPDHTSMPPGEMIERNPGCALVWTSRNGHPVRAPNGILFDIGDPIKVEWFAHGREATREEVEASIDSGVPLLMKLAEQEEGAVEELNRLVEKVRNNYLPVAA